MVAGWCHLPRCLSPACTKLLQISSTMSCPLVLCRKRGEAVIDHKVVAECACSTKVMRSQPWQGWCYRAQHHNWRYLRCRCTLCVTPVGSALRPPPAASSKTESGGCRNKAPSPGSSATLQPSPTGRSILWLHHFGKHESVFLHDAGLWSSVSALSPIWVVQGSP